MYDPNATEMQGKHLIEGVEFEVFRATDHPDLKLPEGWWWDIPLCRTDAPIHPRLDGEYRYANGPFDTSAAAYDHAMKDDGDADA